LGCPKVKDILTRVGLYSNIHGIMAMKNYSGSDQNEFSWPLKYTAILMALNFVYNHEK
jgi:hypothetical protein